MRFCLPFLLLVASVSAGYAQSSGLKAGAYAQDVTPVKYPVSVNGGMSDRQATSAHDRLHARCIVLDDGTTKLAICVVDSCMIPREILDEAKRRASEKTGIPVSNMLISATHTHTAPTLGSVFQSDPNDHYVTFVTQKIAEGIIQAHANLAPAEIASAVVQEPSELFNRRWWLKPGTLLRNPFGDTDLVRMNPGYQNNLLVNAGPIDPDVSILSIRSREGRPLALYCNYSLHYVGDFPALSADYFGVFSERIGSLIGADDKKPAFMGALSNGTSGDVNNVNFAGTPPMRREQGEGCRKVAETVAQAAKKAYGSTKHASDVKLAVAETELELKVRKPDAKALKYAQEILQKAGGKKVLQSMDEVYARETVLINKYPDTVKLKVQAMRIGGIGIVGIPCEVFTEIGLELKRRSPLQPTINVSLANGYNGYLPTPQQHRWGGYETWRARSSYLETNASNTITDTAISLLQKVTK